MEKKQINDTNSDDTHSDKIKNDKENITENEIQDDSLVEITNIKKIRAVKEPDCDKLQYKKFRGDRENALFLYTFDEKQIYIFKDRVRLGETWRCSKYREKKCNSRVIVRTNGDCIKLKSSPAHSHSCDSEKRYFNCLALNAAIKKCSDLGSMASGPQLAKTSAVFNSVLVE